MAEWSSSYVTALPDGAFACVDDSGRHYPHHDASGSLDLPHLRAALSRIGDASNTQCGKGHLEAHARSAGIGEGKALVEMKATVIDDDAFRLLALPYGGPIPYPGAPRGSDMDRQWMTERTDFGDPPPRVNVTWHHGKDPWFPGGADEIVGKAGDLEFDDDGGWVKVWMDAGRRRTRLIKALAEQAKNDAEVNIYGSSEAVVGSGRLKRGQYEAAWRPKVPGEITRWWYSGQTLSTSPQNTNSILMPVKATLEDLASDSLTPTASFFDDLARFLDNLAPDPAVSAEAKAGRVLATRNEARLREARDLLGSDYDASLQVDVKRRKEAVGLISKVLAELEDRQSLLTPVEL